MIPFIQYIRPGGRQVPINIERSRKVERDATRFLAAGGVYSAEKLEEGKKGVIALYAEFDGEDRVCVTCQNGPGVPGNVDELVRKSVEWLDANPPKKRKRKTKK